MNDDGYRWIPDNLRDMPRRCHFTLHLTMYEAALTFRKNINPNVPKPSNAYYKPAFAVLLFLKSVIFGDRY